MPSTVVDKLTDMEEEKVGQGNAKKRTRGGLEAVPTMRQVGLHLRGPRGRADGDGAGLVHPLQGQPVRAAVRLQGGAQDRAVLAHLAGHPRDDEDRPEAAAEGDLQPGVHDGRDRREEEEDWRCETSQSEALPAEGGL